MKDKKQRIKNIKIYEELLQIEDLGNRLQYLRTKYYSISVPDLAKKLNISKNQLYSYERNENFPKAERLKTIADFYNIDFFVLNPKTSNQIYKNDKLLIYDIYDQLYISEFINKNLNYFNKTKICISVCNAILYILSIFPQEYENEFINSIYNILFCFSNDLQKNKNSIVNYIKRIKLGSQYIEIKIPIIFLFRIIERRMAYDFYNQKNFNQLLLNLIDVIDYFNDN